MSTRRYARANKTDSRCHDACISRAVVKIFTPKLRWFDSVTRERSNFDGDLDTAMINWIVYTRCRSISATGVFIDQLMHHASNLLYWYYKKYIRSTIDDYDAMFNRSIANTTIETEDNEVRSRVRSGKYKYVVDATTYYGSGQMWTSIRMYLANVVAPNLSKRRELAIRFAHTKISETGPGTEILSVRSMKRVVRVATINRRLKLVKMYKRTNGHIALIGDHWSHVTKSTYDEAVRSQIMTKYKFDRLFKSSDVHDEIVIACLVAKPHVLIWSEYFEQLDKNVNESSRDSCDMYGPASDLSTDVNSDDDNRHFVTPVEASRISNASSHSDNDDAMSQDSNRSIDCAVNIDNSDANTQRAVPLGFADDDAVDVELPENQYADDSLW